MHLKYHCLWKNGELIVPVTVCSFTIYMCLWLYSVCDAFLGLLSVTAEGDGCVHSLDGATHFTTYTYMKSSRCTPFYKIPLYNLNTHNMYSCQFYLNKAGVGGVKELFHFFLTITTSLVVL